MRRLGPARLAWVPVPVLAAVMLAFRVAGWQGSHESVYLLLALNLVFSTLVCLVVAWLITRSFLARGTPGLLLLGCAVIIWGPAGVVATAAARGDVNTSITIYNSCVWLSGLCHLAGVSLSLWPRRSLRVPPLWLPAAYGGAVGAIILVTLATLAGWIPAFFADAHGGTPVRQIVLSSAVVMFALAALLLAVTGRRSTSAFAYWYALALALMAVGLGGVMLQTYHASILGWTGRATQALGGLYLLIAAVASVRESHVWGVSLEEALQRSEQCCRTLVETAPDAIVVHQDGRFLYANHAALALVGARRFEDLARHTVLDFFRPQDREQARQRIRLALAGGKLPAREALLRRLDGREVAVEFRTAPVAFPRAPAVLTIIRDITERKAAEESLHELNATLETKVAQRTAELERRSRQLQKLTLELTRAEDRERQRIAALLHEDLQQYLAAAKFHLSALRRRAHGDPQFAVVDHVDELLREAIEKSRNLCHDLSPAMLHMNDLGEVLRWLALQVLARYGLTVHVDVRDGAALPSEALTMFLFRAAQEVLSNVIRHARVREATMRVRRAGRSLYLSVTDRGCGFDPQTLRETSGFGLLGIRERIDALGGRMKIRSRPGRGSTIILGVPTNGVAPAAPPATRPYGARKMSASEAGNSQPRTWKPQRMSRSV